LSNKNWEGFWKNFEPFWSFLQTNNSFSPTLNMEKWECFVLSFFSCLRYTWFNYIHPENLDPKRELTCKICFRKCSSAWIRCKKSLHSFVSGKILTGRLSIPKTCSLWNLSLRKTVKKEKGGEQSCWEALYLRPSGTS
jgi:hypothetical protein